MRRIEDVKKGLACHALCRNRLLNCSDCAYHGPGLPPCGKAVHEDAIAMLEQLEAQVPKWISVEERLPEPGVFVVIIIRMGEDTYLRVGWLRGAEPRWMQAGLGLIEGTVTHWMPLPDAPKEDAE